MIRVQRADLSQPQQASDWLQLMNEYAQHPMGGAQPLSPQVCESLPRLLSERAGAFQFLAYVEQRPVGVLNAFEGFSTFKARPLMNIHDVIVTADHRGSGVAAALFDAVTELARQRDCCKLTLEVLQGNLAAQKAYRKLGFEAYQLDPAMGQALFWGKPL